MAESATEEPPSLAEQWSLQDIEKTDQTEASVKQTNGDENPADVSSEEVTAEKNGESFASDAVTEKSDQTPSAEETSAVEEMNGEAPEEQETEVPQVEEKPEIKIETAPADFRFPTTNQTRHCFTRYIEYHRCIAAKGEDASECNKFAKYYRSLCPGEWVERWNEQRENGTFPGPL
ncbi:cytochrome c oxidase subunit 6b-1-like [Musa acuminata AAA Group]|uniref:(wild Malaysian banana) hypothetical protein n=1 Tax=Musa acuminata subsp. malaccensis TaxID=214687 RepID=A0A804K7N9_MUSAM|nr:PREDICTED: cytochrome c oxidase subunit 6b-1-like [Musa acuminata subsp. malaccensis]CAG1831796.1 unnamed protein product [Musa acuminata subsp. malaccensis]